MSKVKWGPGEAREVRVQHTRVRRVWTGDEVSLQFLPFAAAWSTDMIRCVFLINPFGSWKERVGQGPLQTGEG